MLLDVGCYVQMYRACVTSVHEQVMRFEAWHLEVLYNCKEEYMKLINV